jgi:putative ABC transport system permease protein
MRILDEFKEGVLIAWDAIRANKMRAGLTMLGIIIGIVTVTLMGTAITGLNNAFHKSIAGIGADVLFVQRHAWFSDVDWRLLRNRKLLKATDARELARAATLVAGVSVECSGATTVEYGKRKASGVWLLGKDEHAPLVQNTVLREGRWISNSDIASSRPVCVIGSYIADRFFPFGGAIGQRMKIADINHEVIGVLDKQGSFFTGFNFDNQVVIPVTRFTSAMSHWPDMTLLVKVADMKQIEDTVEEVRGVMRRIRHVEPGADDDFAINRQEAMVQVFNRVGGTIAGVGLFITSLSLFVGGIGIMNIMFVSVAERTREIGVRKAIGAKRRAILTQFLIEAATICMVGGFIGLALAWPLTLVINKFLSATMSMSVAFIAIGVSAFTGIVAGFLPAWRASRLDPVEALRSE